MASKRELIALLSDGQWHSGDELGAALNVSRTAIWKQIANLDALGLEITRQKTKGYQLQSPIDLLDAAALHDLVDDHSRFSGIDVFDSIESTNDALLARVRAGNTELYLCTAEQQTAGRGRRGRQWVSPYGQNIYLSACWPVSGGVQALEGLSLAVGVAVVDALTAAGVTQLGLKWPNDVLGPDGKVGGVLIDIAGDPSGEMVAVIGVGINMSLLDSQKQAIDQAAQGANELGLVCSRTALVGELIRSLDLLLADFTEQRFVGYQDRWQALDRFAGMPVELRAGDRLDEGVGVGVDAAGNYGIKDALGNVHWFAGGEVSLRPAP